MEISKLYKIFEQHPVVTTDSRDCPEGSIFFALKGASFDGNKFAAAALEKGCAYAVVDEAEYATDPRCILVDDCLHALQQLALTHRRTLGTKIIGITGTNGKTTTKELVAAVLGEKYNVHYTQGNFNNDIGVPKTLLRLTRQHDIAVVEMGASHPGDIKTLVDIVEPDCGIITNVGRAHLQGFGSFEGVVRTKGELYDFLRQKDGSVVVCSIGFFSNLKALLESGPDRWSKLSGEELVRRKVCLLVSMAGGFPRGYEFNVIKDAAAARAVAERWPTRIIFSGFEIGKNIFTGNAVCDMPGDASSNPVKKAYQLALSEDDRPNGRESWDQTAVLVAIRGYLPWFGLRRGRLIIDEKGNNAWVGSADGPHAYLVAAVPYTRIAADIERLMTHQHR